MKSKFACLVFFVLSVVSVSSAAQSWTHQVNPKADNETKCISPSGQPVGGWYSCVADGTCKNPAAIANQCKARFEATGAPSSGGDLIVIKAKLDQTMKSHSITEPTAECIKNPDCKAAIDAAATYIVVDPKVMTSAMALISAERKGEKGDYHYILPPGYQYCHAKIETLSIVPADGNESSYMTITASDRDLRVQAWTPQSGLFAGKTWIEANFTLIGVRDNLAQQYRTKGLCTDKYVRTFCRGAGRVHLGSPPCGVITDW